MLTENDAQGESFELSFTWGKMRTATQETAPQDSSRKKLLQRGSVGKSVYKISVKGGVQSKDLFLGGTKCLILNSFRACQGLPLP